MQASHQNPQDQVSPEQVQHLNSAAIDVLIEELQKMQIGALLTKSWCAGLSWRLQNSVLQSDLVTREMGEPILSACWGTANLSQNMYDQMRTLMRILRDYQSTMRMMKPTKVMRVKNPEGGQLEQLRLPGL